MGARPRNREAASPHTPVKQATEPIGGGPTQRRMRRYRLFTRRGGDCQPAPGLLELSKAFEAKEPAMDLHTHPMHTVGHTSPAEPHEALR
jgi:hypothetical protein